ncbi:hypothetical protein [Laspinema olomoucense]|uniref:hypothetical protein n=1 Tax=Laspinema olomoucense TaxID=3231600 RepID=UPI0021BA4D32|nr:hypothetical protein [Laspinema sp. D3c]MCT7995918.1 hypothetical protein [Laspinema sp. D3c]
MSYLIYHYPRTIGYSGNLGSHENRDSTVGDRLDIKPGIEIQRLIRYSDRQRRSKFPRSDSVLERKNAPIGFF